MRDLRYEYPWDFKPGPEDGYYIVQYEYEDGRIWSDGGFVKDGHFEHTPLGELEVVVGERWFGPFTLVHKDE